MVDFDDLDDGLSQIGGAAKKVVDAAAIRRNAHVANGGEAATHKCPGCHGSGLWKGYRSCLKCEGTGLVTARVAGAAQAKVTRERNAAEWYEEHRELIEKIEGMQSWNSFAQAMLGAIEAYGKLTDKQLAACQNMIAKVEANRAARREEKAAAAPTVDVSAIERLFDTARSNGRKKLAFNAPGLRISVPKETSRNAGGLYVKHDGEYVGKIMGGRFIATNAARPDTLDRLRAVAADPLGQAIMYGKQTGYCSVCGIELTADDSVELGIGPICRQKWGM